MVSASTSTAKRKHASRIRRPEHHRNVPKLAQSMRAMDETFDVVLVVEGQKFPAQRNWLACASPMLRSMLYGGMKESHEREVSLPMFDARTWSAALDYMYFEDIDVTSLEFGLQLFECARFFELRCLEDAILRALISFLDSATCCLMLVKAEDYGFSRLKNEALAVVAENFIGLSKTNSFSHLSVDLMQEVVASDTLKVRSELDVLEAIIKWAVNHGHTVEGFLLYRIRLESGSCDIPLGGNCFGNVSTEEIMEKLIGHVVLDRLSAFDLRVAARLSREAKLAKLYSSCLEKLLEYETIPWFDTPIPHRARCIRLRHSQMYSFAYPVYGVSIVKRGEDQVTPWAVDPFGKRKRRYGWQVRHIDWVSCFLELKGLVSTDDKTHVHFQLFVQDPDDISRIEYSPVWRENCSKLISSRGTGTLKFMVWKDLKRFISKDSDFVIFGATIYFT